MPTNPTDFDSYAWGVELTSAAYSGGAGGTFTDLVSGAEDWTVQGATPTFETRATQEGVKFSASATERIVADNYAVGEMTFVAIVQPDAGSNMYGFGDAYQSANGVGVNFISSTTQVFTPIGNSGYVAASIAAPFVIAGSVSPENKTIYMTAYDGTLRKASNALTPQPAFEASSISIGAMRTFNFNGWISEIHGFHRALQLRDETALDDMITTLAAKVGL